MKAVESMRRTPKPESLGSAPGSQVRDALPFISLVVPAYNEAAILESNLASLCCHMRTLERKYCWEIVLINDGSRDETGALAEQFAHNWNNIHVLHHRVNRGLGEALRSAIAKCRGDYVVVLDLDLSYSPEHVDKLLARIQETGAAIVVASPYMTGGHVSNVPWVRRTLSVWANRFLSLSAKSNLNTLTGMVRAYDGRFLKSLDLRSTGMDVNPEIIYKALILKEPIDEVPAHLDWKLQVAVGEKRRSSINVMRHIVAVLLAGYLFRPVVFFILPGLAILTVAAYANAWMVIHFVEKWRGLPQYTWALSRASAAAAGAYYQAPHTFIIGLLGLVLAIQLISLGILALQSQRYFEEIFHLGTTIYRGMRQEGGETTAL